VLRKKALLLRVQPILNDANNIPLGPDYQTNYDAAMNDRNLLFRSTTDFLLSFNYGEVKKPRLKFYNCLRFRYVFGGPGVVTTANPTFEIGGTSTTLSSLSIPKNLLWTNEAWLHIAFNKHDDVRDHFLRTGLFPYDIGRGIALEVRMHHLAFWARLLNFLLINLLQLLGFTQRFFRKNLILIRTLRFW